MGSDYELVRYQPDLKSQVIELQTHLWSPSLTLNRAYFDWKFERNPYVDKLLIYLAILDGKAVGMRSFFEVKWQVGVPAQTFIGLYADDAVVAPGHRNRGLMPRIMARAFDDLAGGRYNYLFNLSAGPMTFLTSISMGWRCAGYLQPMARRTRGATGRDGLHRVLKRLPLISKSINAMTSRSVRRRQTLADIDADLARRVSKTIPGISFQDVPRSADMAGLVERIGHSGRIRHVRDTEYFEWRFQNPLSRYRFLYRDTDRLEGYLVLQEYTSESDKRDMVNIVDWEATGTAAKAELLRAALRLIGSRRVVVWSATLTQETIDLLVRNRFSSDTPSSAMVQQCPGILVRAIHDQGEGEWLLGGLRLTDIANWDMRMLYSMSG